MNLGLMEKILSRIKNLMKKLLGIVVLSLLLSGNAYAQNLKFTKIINLDNPWGSSFY